MLKFYEILKKANRHRIFLANATLLQSMVMFSICEQNPDPKIINIKQVFLDGFIFFNGYHGNPQPSFLGVITHILGVKNVHFSWLWGPRVLSGCHRYKPSCNKNALTISWTFPQPLRSLWSYTKIIPQCMELCQLEMWPKPGVPDERWLDKNQKRRRKSRKGSQTTWLKSCVLRLHNLRATYAN